MGNLNQANELFIAILSGTIILLLFSVFLIAFILIYRKRRSGHYQEMLDAKALFSQTLLQTQLEIQEQTLKNISQEIHDNIGQVLSLAKLNINTMRGCSPEALEGKIDDSKLLISKAIQDLRGLSHSLNTDYVVDMGLLGSIEHELEMIQRTAVIETTMKIEGAFCRLEQQRELILFRIVQEILHNIIKHAKATQIDVLLLFEPEMFTLSVADNGVGFDAGKLDAADYSGFGLGIRNMHNRAKMINTDFKLTSTIGKGVTVLLHLPIAEPAKK